MKGEWFLVYHPDPYPKFRVTQNPEPYEHIFESVFLPSEEDKQRIVTHATLIHRHEWEKQFYDPDKGYKTLLAKHLDSTG